MHVLGRYFSEVVVHRLDDVRGVDVVFRIFNLVGVWVVVDWLAFDRPFSDSESFIVLV